MTVVGKIGHGLVVFVGVANEDTPEDIQYLIRKIIELRIFEDTEGKFNLSAHGSIGELLLVSQFTLWQIPVKDTVPVLQMPRRRKWQKHFSINLWSRPDSTGLKVETGKFQTHMLVEINNDGPVTIMIDSRERLNSRSS